MTISKDSNRRADQQLDSSESGRHPTTHPVSLESHPVCRREYIFPTMQLEELAARVDEWIKAGVQDAVIFARPGMGKSLGIRYVSQHLSQQFPDIGCVTIHAGTFPRSARGTNRSFLEKHILEPIERAGQRFAVLWVDDSERLDPATVDILRRVQEETKARKIQLLTLYVGHQRLRVLKQTRVSFASDLPTIVPAVQAEEFELRGLRSPTEIERCLETYDNAWFPIGSDWCYTRFFLPQAYLNGFRLATHARDLWQAFVEEGRESFPDTLTEVPMLYFARTVEQALIDGANRDHVNFTIDRELWKSAVQQSGWREEQLFQLATREMYGADALC